MRANNAREGKLPGGWRFADFMPDKSTITSLKPGPKTVRALYGMPPSVLYTILTWEDPVQ